MKELYSAISRDKTILTKSSSGGFITTLGKWIIEHGGVVYGAVLLDNYSVAHIRANTMEALMSTAGSKYSLSKLSSIMNNLREDVDTGRLVLFVGTPCQCASIRKLYSQRPNLIICDVVCHGNTTKKYFDAYLKYLRKEFGDIKSFSFRDKAAYGLSCISSITLSNGKKKMLYSPKYNYYYYYMKQDAYMEGCYKCRYACLNRVGDLTVGDFWGIENIDKTVRSTDGVNAIIINTEVGKDILEQTMSLFEMKEQPLDEYILYNDALVRATKKGRHYEKVQEMLKSDEAWRIFTDVYEIPMKERIKGGLKRILPNSIYAKLKGVKNGVF